MTRKDGSAAQLQLGHDTLEGAPVTASGVIHWLPGPGMVCNSHLNGCIDIDIEK